MKAVTFEPFCLMPTGDLPSNKVIVAGSAIKLAVDATELRVVRFVDWVVRADGPELRFVDGPPTLSAFDIHFGFPPFEIRIRLKTRPRSESSAGAARTQGCRSAWQNAGEPVAIQAGLMGMI
jgi:hypothetical protein